MQQVSLLGTYRIKAVSRYYFIYIFDTIYNIVLDVIEEEENIDVKEETFVHYSSVTLCSYLNFPKIPVNISPNGKFHQLEIQSFGVKLIKISCPETVRTMYKVNYV
jgi:hypothetical protein